jgi:dihydrofolate reductase
MEHDLVDELRQKIYPVVLGAGKRLFGQTSDKKAMRLVDTQSVDGEAVSSPTSEHKRLAEIQRRHCQLAVVAEGGT